MNTAVLGSVIMALAIVAIGYNVQVYAENGMVGFPSISDDHLIGQHVAVNYHDDNKWTVTVTTQFQVNSPYEVPDTIYYPGIDGQIYTVHVRDGFNLHNNPPEEVVLIPQINATETAQISIDEKNEEREEEKKDIWGKLKTCLVEFQEESELADDDRFDAWMRTSALEDFDVPEDSDALYQQQYNDEELRAEKAWQVCEGLKKYKWIGSYEANKSIEEPLGFTLDDSDSPKTDPVTELDLEQEASDAKDFQCSVQGRQQGHCVTEFTGENRGDPDGYRIPLWYGAWKVMNDDKPDLQQAVIDANQALCDNYMVLYEHKLGQDSFPKWLDHCPDTRELDK